MSAEQQDPTYERSGLALWRDTGRHVVVVPTGADGEVQVLGGGGAAIWRHLAEPCRAEDLQRRFAEQGQAPDVDLLTEHLEELCELRVLIARRTTS